MPLMLFQLIIVSWRSCILLLSCRSIVTADILPCSCRKQALINKNKGWEERERETYPIAGMRWYAIKIGGFLWGNEIYHRRLQLEWFVSDDPSEVRDICKVLRVVNVRSRDVLSEITFIFRCYKPHSSLSKHANHVIDEAWCHHAYQGRAIWNQILSPVRANANSISEIFLHHTSSSSKTGNYLWSPLQALRSLRFRWA